MKFRNLVLLFIMLILLLAWFTKPGYEDFQKFQAVEASGIKSPPVIEFTNGLVYSMFTVTYFDIKDVPVKVEGGSRAAIAVPQVKEKYLGLFGRFWKM